MNVEPSISRETMAEALKQAAITIGKKGLMDFITLRITQWAAGKSIEKLITGLWFIANPVVGLIVGHLLVYLVKQTEFGLFFWYIDARTSKQGRDFAAAAIVNRDAQLSGTPDEKKNAEKRLRETFYQFASWRG